MGRREVIVVAALTACVQAAYGPDWISFARWGIFPTMRPAAPPRPVLGVHSVRFDEGAGIELAVSLQGAYPVHPEYPMTMKASAYRYRVHATIETTDGEQIPLGCRWEWLGGPERGCVTALPELPDGDHILRITADSPMGSDAVVEVPLPYYTPANAHLLTDRPRYTAGDTLLARSLTYARADLRPVADRPGTWTLLQNTSRPKTELFREAATADAWGVATLSLKLPETLPDGHYTLRWESGDTVAEQAIWLEDIEMPWLLVDAAPTQGWFAPGEVPAFSGTLQTADGRPAADAVVTTQVSVTGWPAPTDWLEPQTLRTDAEGRFSLALSEIPHDLRAPETLAVELLAEDKTGTISTGTVTVPISPDTMRVEAVTAIDGKLLEGRSNRVYLRLTTPDGQPLTGETARIESAVDARDVGRDATTDADGVLMVQLDPGPAISMVDPPLPVREQPAQTDTFSLAEGRALLEDRVLSLSERDALAALLPALDRACGQLIGTAQTTPRLISAKNGRIDAVTPRTGGLGRCVSDALAGRPWPTRDGLWEVQLAEHPDPSRPKLVLRTDDASQATGSLTSALSDAAARAGACVKDATEPIETLGYARWHVAADEETPQLWFSPSVPTCIQQAFAGIRVSEQHDGGQGAVWLSLEIPRAAPQAPPEPRVRQGWRYRVRVGDRVGYWTTHPAHSVAGGLRAVSPIVDEGEPITMVPTSGHSVPEVATLHGPGGWSQTCARADVDTDFEVSPDCPDAPERGWRFQPPRESGFYWSRDHGTAFAYVRPQAPAALSLSTDKDAYAPGETGTLLVETGGPAVVSLVGHDERLGRVMSLAAPEDLQAAMLPFSPQRTFGAFTLLDLVSGRVRGEAAALAILTEVTHEDREEEEPPWDDGFTDVYQPDTEAETGAAVASVAFAVQKALRASGQAPLSYDTFAELWDDEVDRQGAIDAWGRPLRLPLVPDQLASKIDPRVLAGDATRFPEDIEPWSEWLARSHR